MAFSFQQNRTRHRSIARIGRATAQAPRQYRRACHCALRVVPQQKPMHSLPRFARLAGRQTHSLRTCIPDGAATLAMQVRAIVGGHLDIFFRTPVFLKAAAIEDHTIEDFDNLFATNVRSPFSS